MSLILLFLSLSPGKSTDEELLDLMLELAQTPVGTATQLSQSLYQSQNVASSLCDRLTRPSSSSSSSLSPPRASKTGDSSISHSQPVANTSMAGFKTSYTGSQPVSRTSSGSKSDPSTTENIQTREENVETMLSDADRFLVALDPLNWSSSEADPSNLSGRVMAEASCDPHTSTKPAKLVNQPVERGSSPINKPSPRTPSKSPVFSDTDLFDTDFSSSPLFLISPPSPPPPPHDTSLKGSSAGSEERTGDREGDDGVRDPSVMLNSGSVSVGDGDSNSGEIGGDPELMSEFDIPCAQPVVLPRETSHSPQAARVSSSLQDVLKNGSHDDETLVPKVTGSVAVQLEYEMPEISLSHFESFHSSTTEILGTPSKMAGTNQPQKPDHVKLERVKEGNFGVNEEMEASTTETERVKESPLDVSSSLINSEGSDPLLESSLVAPGNTLAAALCSQNPPKESSTPFRGKDDKMERGREGEGEREEMPVSEEERRGREREGGEGMAVSLSASQRRAILRQLSCATGDLSDGEGEEVGGETEEEEEGEEGEEEWMGGDWSSNPLTIPERYNGLVEPPNKDTFRPQNYTELICTH